MKRLRSAVLLLPLALFAASCAAPQADNLRETYLDADYKALDVIDVAVVKPSVASKSEVVLAGIMRTAARQYLLDTKAYSVVADEATDAAASAAGVDANSDGPSAARGVASAADAVLLISVTEWDREWLVPRGAVYASGKVAIYARRDGRRLYETTFTRERLAAPGRLNELNVGEAEKQMAIDLVRVSLAGLPKKISR
jgi:hypothetical protein